MNPIEQKRLELVGGSDQLRAMVVQLVNALEQADEYLNSYDTSKPSRIKAQTRAAVAEALGLAKA